MKDIFVYHIIFVFDNKIDAQNKENLQGIYFIADTEDCHYPVMDFLKYIGTYRYLFERKDSAFRVDRIERSELNEQE